MSVPRTSPMQKAVLRAMAAVGQPASIEVIANEHDIHPRPKWATMHALIRMGLVCAGLPSNNAPVPFELTQGGWNYVEIGYAGRRRSLSVQRPSSEAGE